LKNTPNREKEGPKQQTDHSQKQTTELCGQTTDNTTQ
jgi:hypothetical protein